MLYEPQAKKNLNESFYGGVIWLLSVKVDLLWKSIEEKKNSLNERSLRIVCCNSSNSVQGVLQKDHSFTIHHRNVQILDAELYKVRGNFFNENIAFSFKMQNQCDTYYLGIALPKIQFPNSSQLFKNFY